MSRKNALVMLAALAALALTAGCGSSTSVPTAIDTAPPASPTGLSASGAPLGLLLSWEPNTTDADFAGFVVRRNVLGRETTLIDTPTDVTECVDPSPAAGYVNRYEVSSVDESGNESAFAYVLVDLSGNVPELRPAVSPFSEVLVGDESPAPGGPSDRRDPH